MSVINDKPSLDDSSKEKSVNLDHLELKKERANRKDNGRYSS